MLTYGRRISRPIDQTLDRYWENGIVPYVVRPFPVRQHPAFKSEIGVRGKGGLRRRAKPIDVVRGRLRCAPPTASRNGCSARRCITPRSASWWRGPRPVRDPCRLAWWDGCPHAVTVEDWFAPTNPFALAALKIELGRWSLGAARARDLVARRRRSRSHSGPGPAADPGRRPAAGPGGDPRRGPAGPGLSPVGRRRKRRRQPARSGSRKSQPARARAAQRISRSGARKAEMIERIGRGRAGHGRRRARSAVLHAAVERDPSALPCCAPQAAAGYR